MTSLLLERTFTFETEDTCKQEWRFSLRQGADGLVIQDLAIQERGTPRGCLGHPATIVALVRGRTVDSLDLEALAQAACVKSLACAQILARCLREIRRELESSGGGAR